MSHAAVGPDPELRLSREEYRAWVDAQPRGRFERIEGVVVAMAPERLGHVLLKARVWAALDRAVRALGLPCQVFPDGVTVTVDENDFEPDATLRRGAPLPLDRTSVPDPMVVVEVLSPSTREGDLTRKLVAYFRVPSVRHYLIFWTDRPQVIHHRRRDDGEGIETRMRTEGEIGLDPPGIAIWMDEIYRE